MNSTANFQALSAPSTRDSSIPAGYAFAITGRTYGQQTTGRGMRLPTFLIVFNSEELGVACLTLDVPGKAWLIL